MATPSVIINLEPDWGYTPEISYAFETVIQPTPYFVEQRRPLLPTPVRIQGCRYAFSGKSLQYARNLFLYGLSKLCCIPIYSEPVFSAAVTQGATSITATTDLTYLWNIKNSDWLILLDFVSGQSEMLGISSVAGQVINLSSAIVNSWTASRTIIFPAFAGTISKVKGMDTTDRVGRVDVEFEEQAIGEVATKSWVGLDEQICHTEDDMLENFLTWGYAPQTGLTVAKHQIDMSWSWAVNGYGGPSISYGKRTFNDFSFIFEITVTSLNPALFPESYQFAGVSLNGSGSPFNTVALYLNSTGAGQFAFCLRLYTTSDSYVKGINRTSVPFTRWVVLSRVGTVLTAKIYNNGVLEETLTRSSALFTNALMTGPTVNIFFQYGSSTQQATFSIRNMLKIN